VPAAAVIPAPIASIKVVAVKKLVVGFRSIPFFLLLCSFSFFTFEWELKSQRRRRGGQSDVWLF